MFSDWPLNLLWEVSYRGNYTKVYISIRSFVLVVAQGYVVVCTQLIVSNTVVHCIVHYIVFTNKTKVTRMTSVDETFTCESHPWGLLVAYWLKHCNADWKVQGSSPTCSRDSFLFWVYSGLPHKLSRRFSFASFGGNVKAVILGNPLKLAQVLLGISSLTGKW